MGNEVFEQNLSLVDSGLACENYKPISCYTGAAVGAVIAGMSVADFCADPVAGARASIQTIQRIQEAAGPLRSFNGAPRTVNMVVSITMMWNSRVLIPGIDIPADSVWQVKEEQLIGREAYDQIMQQGYATFVQSEVMPRIIDQGYLQRYQQIAAQAAPEIDALLADMGIPIFNGAPSTMVPFEQLCGMRSMQEFYRDCYKIPDKLKEVSDFIFAETYARTEETWKAFDNPLFRGGWIGGWRTASAMVNPMIWESLVWPYMKRSAEQMISHGRVATMHLDSCWDRDIERFGELPQGCFIINTDGMTDLPRARQKLPKAALMGDVPPPLLTTGTPQQVTDYVNRLIDEVGPQGLFVCPGCDTPVNAKFENMVAMVKATNDWS
ncbi:MAG: methyltransferase [Coriobacteriia bacterium]|nr:methyltransferase [Coriobacteriia bacterium]